MEASEYVLHYNPTLGNSFALATAEDVEAMAGSATTTTTARYSAPR